jgi:rsbT antagonist protein RsbS
VTPILKQRDLLIATLPAAPSEDELRALESGLAAKVGRVRARGAVLDVTAMEVMDSFAVRTLRTMAEALRLRGVATVIVGIGPEVAIDLVRLGLGFGEVPTALDLEEGLSYLSRM